MEDKFNNKYDDGYNKNTTDNKDMLFLESYNIVKPKKKSKFLKYTVSLCVVASLSSASFGWGYGAFKNTKQSKEVANTSASSSLMYTASSSGFTSSKDIFKNVSNSVVSINSKIKNNNFNGYKENVGAGSGIIFHEDNEKIYIVTNDHVISGATSVTISIDDKIEVNANFVGTDVESDIAVISVDKANLKNAGIKDYKIATFGDSSILEVGEPVLAIGNAVGEGKSATSGIVSAINKKINIDGKALDVVQTDAAINPGNSGGALVNDKGQIIGINTAKFSSYGIEGMGYSIPSNNVKKIVENLLTNKNISVNKPFLGIQGETITDRIRSYYNLPKGVYMVNVIAGGSAYVGGLKTGDIVVSYNGVETTTMEQLSTLINATKVGDKVVIEIYRDGNVKMKLEVTMQNVNSTKF